MRNYCPARVSFVLLLLLLGGCSSTPKDVRPATTDITPSKETVSETLPQQSINETPQSTTAETKSELIEKQKDNVEPASVNEPVQRKAKEPAKKAKKEAEKPKASSQQKSAKKPTPTKKAPTKKEQPKVVAQPISKIANKTKATSEVKEQQTVVEEVNSEIDSEPLLKDLSQLPLKLNEIWTLDREPNTQSGCLLYRQGMTIFDGQGETPVTLSIGPELIRFKTKSNVDLSYPNIGIRTVKTDLIAIEKVESETNIAFQESYQTLIAAFKSEEKVSLALGFWPTWPITETNILEFDISGFNQAYTALQNCIALERDLK